MKEIIICIFASILVTSCYYGSLVVNYLSFDYADFEQVGIAISPFDAPPNYKLIGEYNSRIFSQGILLDAGINVYAAEFRNKQGHYDAVIATRIKDFVIQQAKLYEADAVYGFSVTPLSETPSKDFSECGYKLRFVLARKIN